MDGNFCFVYEFTSTRSPPCLAVTLLTDGHRYQGALVLWFTSSLPLRIVMGSTGTPPLIPETQAPLLGRWRGTGRRGRRIATGRRQRAGRLRSTRPSQRPARASPRALERRRKTRVQPARRCWPTGSRLTRELAQGAGRGRGHSIRPHATTGSPACHPSPFMSRHLDARGSGRMGHLPFSFRLLHRPASPV